MDQLPIDKNCKIRYRFQYRKVCSENEMGNTVVEKQPYLTEFKLNISWWCNPIVSLQKT